jgi:hypothetical protein
VRQINLTLSLAFLAPQLVKATEEGRLPRGTDIERLRDADADWSRQFQGLGFRPDQVSAFDCVAAAVSQLRPSARAHQNEK